MTRRWLTAICLLATMVLTLILTATPATASGDAFPVRTAPSDLVLADGGGVMGPLNPTDANGVRVDHYDVMGDDGSADFGKKIILFFSNLLFAIDRWIVGLAAWLVEWVLEFKITTYLGGGLEGCTGLRRYRRGP